MVEWLGHGEHKDGVRWSRHSGHQQTHSAFVIRALFVRRPLDLDLDVAAKRSNESEKPRGHAAAAPPSSNMNSRRFMSDLPLQSRSAARSACHTAAVESYRAT